MTYTIERLFKASQFDYHFLDFATKAGRDLNARFGHPYNWQKFNLFAYAQKHRVVVCRKEGEIVGVMLSRLGHPLFDPTLTVCRQDLLYTLDPRATRLLLKDFIDFGKANADHIITMLTPHTNISERSLKRLGFGKLETIYRMEK